MERFSGIEGRGCLKWGGKRAAELAIRGPSPSEPHPGLRTAPAALRASVWSAEVAPAWRTEARWRRPQFENGVPRLSREQRHNAAALESRRDTLNRGLTSGRTIP